MDHNADQLILPEILQQYDRLSHAGNFSAAGEFLRTVLARAQAANECSIQLTVLSEMMGLYRMAGDRERTLEAVEKGLALLETMDLADPVSGGTILINAATALQAIGMVPRALLLYRRAEEIYRDSLKSDDPLLAGLFNNMAAAYEKNGDRQTAEKLYLQALDILQQCGIKTDSAVTYINLAVLYAACDPELCQNCLDAANMLLDDPALARDSYYMHTCGKCIPVFRMLGREALADKFQSYLDRMQL
ncbi:MAG: tetratricopeptide repeat protein [Lentisphaerae bacterium]|nr:tetratricopeptide repeat protein [Lentisphaerota bacterium]